MRLGARDDDDRKGFNPLPLIGLALYVIGYVGVFFGNLIKAAVSRQREFLADASAVQFTRNPEGLAGALKKIGALAEGSRIGIPTPRRRATCSSARPWVASTSFRPAVDPPSAGRADPADRSFVQRRLFASPPGHDPARSAADLERAFEPLATAGRAWPHRRAGRRGGGDHRSRPHRLCRRPQGIDAAVAHGVAARSAGCPGGGLRPLARSRRSGSTSPACLAGCLRPAGRGARDQEARRAMPSAWLRRPGFPLSRWPPLPCAR